jgi:hypothetical protein
MKKLRHTSSAPVVLATQLWNCLGIAAPLQPDNVTSWPRPDMIPSEGFSTFIALCCWQLWKSKNKKVFRNQATGLNQLLQQCSAVSVQWGFRLQPSKRHIVQAWELAFESARQGEGWVSYFTRFRSELFCTYLNFISSMEMQKFNDIRPFRADMKYKILRWGATPPVDSQKKILFNGRHFKCYYGPI